MVGASAAEAAHDPAPRVALEVPLHVDVTYTSIMVSAPDIGGSAPVTMVRTVPALARDYARLGHLVGIVDRVGR